jgi:hypothetical protein
MVKYFYNEWDGYAQRYIDSKGSLRQWTADRYFVGTVYGEVYFMFLLKDCPNNTVEVSAVSDWHRLHSYPLSKSQKKKTRDVGIYLAMTWAFDTIGIDSMHGFVRHNDKKIIGFMNHVNGAPMKPTEKTTASGIPFVRWDYSKEEYNSGLLLERAKESIYNFE